MDKKTVDNIFDCYNATVTVEKRYSLEEDEVEDEEEEEKENAV